MNSFSYRVQENLVTLADFGMTIAPSLKERIEAEASQADTSIGAAPFANLVGWLGQWINRFHDDPALLNLTGNLLQLLEIQASFVIWQNSAIRQTGVLLVKRYLWLVAHDPAHIDIVSLAHYLIERRELPDQACHSDSVMKKRSVATVITFLREANRLLSGHPIVPMAETTHQSSEEGQSGAADLGPLKPVHPVDHLRPILQMLIARLFEGQLPENRDERRCLFLVILEAFFGLFYKDALTLGVGENGEKFGPGYLTPEHLVRFIGSPFFSGADTFRRSELVLPLPQQIVFLLNTLGLDFSQGQNLGDQFGNDFHERHARWITRILEKYECGITSGQKTFVWTFDYVAIEKCAIEPAILSLLRGHPLYGSRGRCAYVAITGRELCNTLQQIMQGVVDLLGMKAQLNIDSPQPDTIHGNPCDSYADMVEEFAKGVDRAVSPTQIISCVERLMLLLGKRRTLVHPNPAYFARHLPGPHLIFSDKPWIHGQSHSIPCPPNLWAIIKETARIFGPSPSLMYPENGLLVPSDQCREPGCKVPLSTGFPLQPARNSFINHLIGQQTPTHIIDYLVGHNSGGLSPLSGALPLPGAALFHAAYDAIQDAIAVGRFPETLQRLHQKLLTLSPVHPHASGFGDTMDRFSYSPDAPATLVSGPIVLSSEEDGLGTMLLDGLRRQCARVGHFSPRNQADILVALSLESSMPVGHLKEYAAYIRAENFLRAAECAVFLCPIPTEDAGGLSLFPVVLSGELGVIKTLQKWFDWRNRDYNHRQGESAMHLTPIGSVTPEEMAKSVNGALRYCGFRQKLSAEEAWRLLHRISEHRCRMMHAGPVWAVTTHLLSAGLNNIKLTDSFREMGLGSLALLDGSTWEASNAVHAEPSAADRQRWVHNLAEKENHAKSADVAAHLAERFHDRGFFPHLATFRKWATKYGETIGVKHNGFAHNVARTAMKISTERVWLQVSEAAALPSTQEMTTAITKLPDIVRCRKPQIKDGCNSDKASQRLASKGQLAVALDGMVEVGLRVGEASVCPPPLNMGLAGNDLRFLIKHRKNNEAVPRYADAEFFALQGNQVRRLMTFVQPAKIKGHPIAKIASDTIARSIKAAFERSDVSPHGVRRHVGFRMLVRVSTEMNVRPGSGVVRLAMLTWQFGHAGLTVLPCSYAGTALCALSMRPDRQSTLGIFGGETISVLSQRAMVCGVSTGFIKFKEHSTILRRQLRALRSLVARRASQREEVPADSDGTDFELVCEGDEPSPTSHPEFTLSITAGPDFDTMSTVVQALFTASTQKQVSVRCILTRSNQFPVSPQRLRRMVESLRWRLADHLASSAFQE